MWGLAASVGLKMLDIFVRHKATRDRQKKAMLQFVRRFDNTILDDAKLRAQYNELKKLADKDASA